MNWIEKIETWMVKVTKKMPAMPSQNKKSVVQMMPWLVLILGALQIVTLLSIAGATLRMHELINTVPHIGINGATIVASYVSAIVTAASALLFFAAYTPLQQRLRRGWKLLFLVGLLSAVMVVVSPFAYGQDFSSALLSLAITLLIFYLLMQIRSEYNGHKKSRRK